MSRHTGNDEVVRKLQNALEAFLADHRKEAKKDREWIAATERMTPEDREKESGCGCDDCEIAGQLLGNIY